MYHSRLWFLVFGLILLSSSLMTRSKASMKKCQMDCNSVEGFGIGSGIIAGQCLNATDICDDKDNCPNGVDELHCANQLAKSHHIRHRLPSPFLPKGHLFGKAKNHNHYRGLTNRTATMPEKRLITTILNRKKKQSVAHLHHFYPTGKPMSLFRACSSHKQVKSTGQLVYSPHWCDGIRDCVNGEDEKHCPVQCKAGQFRCASDNSICLDESKVCNGKLDCQFGEDELSCTPAPNCHTGSEVMCPHNGRFFATKQCISLSKVCDGHKDCLTGWDELKNCNQTSIIKCNINGLSSRCSEKCVTVGGKARCACPIGLESSNVGGKYKCQDVNECNAHWGICSQKCENKEHGYQCKCKSGWKLLESGEKQNNPISSGHRGIVYANGQTRGRCIPDLQSLKKEKPNTLVRKKREISSRKEEEDEQGKQDKFHYREMFVYSTGVLPLKLMQRVEFLLPVEQRHKEKISLKEKKSLALPVPEIASLSQKTAKASLSIDQFSISAMDAYFRYNSEGVIELLVSWIQGGSQLFTSVYNLNIAQLNTSDKSKNTEKDSLSRDVHNQTVSSGNELSNKTTKETIINSTTTVDIMKAPKDLPTKIKLEKLFATPLQNLTVTLKNSSVMLLPLSFATKPVGRSPIVDWSASSILARQKVRELEFEKEKKLKTLPKRDLSREDEIHHVLRVNWQTGLYYLMECAEVLTSIWAVDTQKNRISLLKQYNRSVTHTVHYGMACDLAIDVPNNRIFWTDGVIWYMNIDGTKEMPLLEHAERKRASTLAIDYGTDRLFWLDIDDQRLYSIDSKSTDTTTIRYSSIKMPKVSYASSMFVAEGDKIYWVLHPTRKPNDPLPRSFVQSVDKFYGTTQVSGFETLTITGVCPLNAPSAGATANNIDEKEAICAKKNCPYICVVTSTKSAICLTPNLSFSNLYKLGWPILQQINVNNDLLNNSSEGRWSSTLGIMILIFGALLSLIMCVFCCVVPKRNSRAKITESLHTTEQDPATEGLTTPSTSTGFRQNTVKNSPLSPQQLWQVLISPLAVLLDRSRRRCTRPAWIKFTNEPNNEYATSDIYDYLGSKDINRQGTSECDNQLAHGNPAAIPFMRNVNYPAELEVVSHSQIANDTIAEFPREGGY